MHSLTPVQQQVLILLAQGSTISAAAAQTGTHRNTIGNWRRSSSSFRDAWARVQFEQAMYWRDEMQSLGALAVETLRAVLTDQKASPSIRLRAALAVLDKISKPAPAQPEFALDAAHPMTPDQAYATLLGKKVSAEYRGAEALDDQPPNTGTPDPTPHVTSDVHSDVHSDVQPPAQSCTTAPLNSPVAKPAAVRPTPVHNLAQVCPKPPNRTAALHEIGGLPPRPLTRHPIRPASEPGRNNPCPCGSGLKYKKCCLVTPKLAQAA